MLQIGDRWFLGCQKPDCERVVPESSAYCCTACQMADDARCEIDAHSPGCDERWAERRPYAAAAGGHYPSA